MKKTWKITIILIIILSITLYYIISKNKNNKKIILDIETSNNVIIIYDPIFEDTIKLDVGQSLTLLPTFINVNKNDVNYIIEDSNIVNINNNIIKSLKEGTTKIYMTNNDETIISNTLNIKVGDIYE